jgi:hypothetical protein
MKELQLKIKKRAFPSQGRIRLNESALSDLGIQNGTSVDLVNEVTGKVISVTVYADTSGERAGPRQRGRLKKGRTEGRGLSHCQGHAAAYGETEKGHR